MDKSSYEIGRQLGRMCKVAKPEQSGVWSWLAGLPGRVKSLFMPERAKPSAPAPTKPTVEAPAAPVQAATSPAAPPKQLTPADYEDVMAGWRMRGMESYSPTMAYMLSQFVRGRDMEQRMLRDAARGRFVPPRMTPEQAAAARQREQQQLAEAEERVR